MWYCLSIMIIVFLALSLNTVSNSIHETFLLCHIGDNLQILRQELKSQRKHIKSLKKKSLWSKILEEVMEKLVDIVHFLHLEIHELFGSADMDQPVKSLTTRQRLGSAGLSLHYAKIISQIVTLLTVPQIKAEMEKTLRWLVPIAANTIKAHHVFGSVGEWANTGPEMNRKPVGQTDLIRIETLHHTEKEKTEAYILDLVVWLHHLISQSRGLNGGIRSPIKYILHFL